MKPALEESIGNRESPQGDRLELLVDGLAEQGWCVVDGLFDDELLDNLAAEAESALSGRHFHPAAIGKQVERRVDRRNRSDQILWLDSNRPSAAQQGYWEFIEALRIRLNRDLCLGLRTFEAQFSAYPPGAYYARHIDQFRGDDTRVVTCIAYLNRDWKVEEGGQLRLYLNEETTLDVQPEMGRLVVFLSDRFFHEVLPAQRLRFALSGWFRRFDPLG